MTQQKSGTPLPNGLQPGYTASEKLAAHNATQTPAAQTPAATGLVKQSAGEVSAGGMTYAPTAYTGTVDPSKTTAGLVSQVMNTNGELMRIASQQGTNDAIRRGMGNSSIASQASMGAMIGAALPIAQSDAQIYQNQATQNQNAMNLAAGASNEVAASEIKTRQQQELSKLEAALRDSTIGVDAQNKLILSYSEGVNSILGNPDMTSEQKEGYINKLYENTQKTLAIQGATASIDLSKYKPTGTAGAPGTASPGGTAVPGMGLAAAFGAGSTGAGSAPAGSITEQFNALLTRGVGVNDIAAAQAAGYPLVLPSGAFLVKVPPPTTRTINDNGETRQVPSPAVYYNQNTGTYSMYGGSQTGLSGTGPTEEAPIGLDDYRLKSWLGTNRPWVMS